MALSVVVLPAPLEPSSATMLPCCDRERHVGDAHEVAVAHLEMLDHRAPLIGAAACARRGGGRDRPRSPWSLTTSCGRPWAMVRPWLNTEHARRQRQDHLHDVLDDHDGDAERVDLAHQRDGALDLAGVSPASASSSSSSLGSVASTRAISSRLRPGVPRLRAGWSLARARSSAAPRCALAARRRVRMAQEGAHHRRSRGCSCPRRSRAPGRCGRCRGAPALPAARVTSTPSNRCGRRRVSPAMQLKNVDLPAPFGPIRPTISPASTESRRPRTARSRRRPSRRPRSQAAWGTRAARPVPELQQPPGSKRARITMMPP